MRGELLNVWEDTYREIWTPLTEEEGVPTDLFSQLYRELSPALKEPLGEDAQVIPLSDAIQLREAFDRALSLSGVEIALAAAEVAFGASGATNHEDLHQRRSAAEECLAALLGDAASAKRLLSQSLSGLANDPDAAEGGEHHELETPSSTTRPRAGTHSSKRDLPHLLERSPLSGFSSRPSRFSMISVANHSPTATSTCSPVSSTSSACATTCGAPCILCPTLPGVFASLVRDLQALTSQDPHLDGLMKDLRTRPGPAHSIARIEAVSRRASRSSECSWRRWVAPPPASPKPRWVRFVIRLGTWPHATLKEAMKKLYGFASDYPGIRHGGTPASALRAVDMRDMVAMSILLVGFTPYLTHGLNPDIVYRGT